MAVWKHLKLMANRLGWRLTVLLILGAIAVLVSASFALAPTDSGQNPGDTADIDESNGMPDSNPEDGPDSDENTVGNGDETSENENGNSEAGDGNGNAPSDEEDNDNSDDEGGEGDDQNGEEDDGNTDEGGDEGDNTSDNEDDDSDNGGSGEEDNPNDSQDGQDGDDGGREEDDKGNEGDDSESSEFTWTVTVTEVVDGDTLDIAYQNGTSDTVRLLGVDTPEVHVDVSPGEYEGVADTPATRECLRDFGNEASSYAREQLLGETVTLRVDAEADRRGVYGRILGYILVNRTNFNYQLVAGGYARVFDSTFNQSERFYDAEATAQASVKRVWSCRLVDSGDDGDDDDTGDRSLTVSQVHADAAGNDHENLNDEYIVFSNNGNEAIDMSGWSVSDEAGYNYQFPTGFALGAGDSVTLHTGSGEDTASDLFWGQGSAVWNNGGDTVIVANAGGEIVLKESYN